MSSLEKCLFRSFAQFIFFDWAVCFLIMRSMSCLYIFKINLLSFVSFANIFSHSSGRFFILFMISFTAQKLLSLIGSHFCFIFITLGCGLKKILLWFMSKSLCLFSSISFVVSGLTFMSLIHFEFIFVYGIRVYSNFTLLHVAVQFSLQHYWRDSFSILYSCLLVIDYMTIS